MIGPDKIVGASASNLSEALTAVNAGADYIGVGAMYATDTKKNAAITTMDELRIIRKAVKLPIVVIGGINWETAQLFHGIGIDGLVVVSAIVTQKDVRAAAEGIKSAFLKKEG